jgi:hypothetical protein
MQTVATRVAKSQNAADTTVAATVTEAALQSLMVGQLGYTARMQVLVPDALFSQVGEDFLDVPPNARAAIEPPDAVNITRDTARHAASAAKITRKTVAKVQVLNDKDTGKQRAPNLARTAAQQATARALSKIADEKDKKLAALYTVDAQGGISYDAAVRNGRLHGDLLASNARVLSLMAETGDIDIYATDGLLLSLSVGLSAHTTVTLPLANYRGNVLTDSGLIRCTGLNNVGSPRWQARPLGADAEVRRPPASAQPTPYSCIVR